MSIFMQHNFLSTELSWWMEIMA